MAILSASFAERVGSNPHSGPYFAGAFIRKLISPTV